MTTFEIHHGDCLDVLRSMPDCSVDAVVTDPPYGLSFMGRKWDYDVPGVEIWAECLRVLKPGGHLLAFAGTRTQHRMCCRIEDAGFEIRDMIAWVYGSGFPKSLDVGKAIDKMDAADEQEQRRYRFTRWVVSRGVTAKQINACLAASDMGRHYTDVPPNGKQPAIMTREHLEQCRHLFGDVPEWVERECDIRSVESRNFAEREVIGHRERGFAPGTNDVYGAYSGDTKITAPATDAAKKWHGWGTALKPALEPITVARKPLIGTVAENVLTHGTGAINVDACRVENLDYDPSKVQRQQSNRKTWEGGEASGFASDHTQPTYNASGRWPANLIHDGSGEPTSLLGEAARFFYCAKASKSDRDEGMESWDAVHGSAVTGRAVGSAGAKASAYAGTTETPRRNFHPTVKPTDLMRYLCRLVTPPGGTVLDPFTGSGSTGKAAILEGFRFIGIEREAEYVEIAKARIGCVESPLLAGINNG